MHIQKIGDMHIQKIGDVLILMAKAIAIREALKIARDHNID